MGFLQAIKYGFRHWLDFKGRCPRSVFWWWTLFGFLLGLLSLPELLLWGSEISNWLITLFLFIPTFSLLVRRFHDTGLSGKIVLLSYLIWLPLIVAPSFDDKIYDMTSGNIYQQIFFGLLALLIFAIFAYICIRCGFYKTQAGENKYGAPLDVAKL